ncbi:hypothetical protein VCHA50P416_90155 [Vibrio chagasii]|nr:hypothetical protein VCHA43P272_100023 [Vibrio chagasii]CAH7392001.1 hypothetical protein VCHA42P256_90155 [Vibrio chagasii]CAH7483016.1 hypothetical protein VCHA50P416_90155 [Vibrio chagasii]
MRDASKRDAKSLKSGCEIRVNEKLKEQMRDASKRDEKSLKSSCGMRVSEMRKA